MGVKSQRKNGPTNNPPDTTLSGPKSNKRTELIGCKQLSQTNHTGQWSVARGGGGGSPVRDVSDRWWISLEVRTWQGRPVEVVSHEVWPSWEVCWSASCRTSLSHSEWPGIKNDGWWLKDGKFVKLGKITTHSRNPGFLLYYTWIPLVYRWKLGNFN